ncbi:hypothetical protein HG66A1_41350 [Gimesia chilikensis]|jgi:hypothetical protein|uniref:Uncharacterized protein n=1 Tax=Gimesia chilikensis TaxID=2605989 RepID=A0A517PSH7_9PLAN|nr:hypothetical protein HG66A1_41350 [Gimesia chilikensis]QDT86258.1 hypothetical protein MalM14_39320 [Gimesia chilikensis]
MDLQVDNRDTLLTGTAIAKFVNHVCYEMRYYSSADAT